MWLLPLFLHTTVYRIKLAASAFPKKFRHESGPPVVLLCAENRLARLCSGAVASAGWACHRVPCLRYVDRAARVLGARAIITDRIMPAHERPFGPVPRTLPIVFVGRAWRETDALEAGAALFLSIPIDVPSLIQGLSRVAQPPISQEWAQGPDPNGLYLDPATASARVGSAPLALSRRHFHVLYELVRNPGKLMTTERLCSGLADMEPMTPAALITCIWRLRKILHAAGVSDCIETVHHIGYRYATSSSQGKHSDLASRQESLRYK